MRRVGDGRDPNAAYESEWVGGKGGGRLVIGVLGTAGLRMNTLGLMQAE